MDANLNPTPPISIPETFTPVKRNRWVIHEDASYARWEARFPKGQMTDPWELWPFLKGVLQSGEEEEVFRVEKTWGDPPTYEKIWDSLPVYDRKALGQSYAEYVEETLRQTGELVFFQQLGNNYSLDAPARLCYFDLEGNLLEAEVPERKFGGLGGLLRQLRPDMRNDPNAYLNDYWLSRNHNPLGFDGQRGREWKRENFPDWTDEEFEQTDKFQQAYLVVETHTDIWFPWISGHMEEEDRGWRTDIIDGKAIVYQEGELYDNRELALCHTPRLNRFIQRVRQLTLDYGGAWSLDERESSEELNEDGIVLDI